MGKRKSCRVNQHLPAVLSRVIFGRLLLVRPWWWKKCRHFLSEPVRCRRPLNFPST